MPELDISGIQLAEIAAHAVAELPRECCGVLLGRRRTDRVRVESVRTADNVAEDPTTGYEIEPQALAATQRYGRDRGLEIVGYYHSHPDGRAVPSRRDLEAAWPEAIYLIVSTRNGAVSAQRSWQLGADGRFEERPLLPAEGDEAAA